MPRLSLTSLTKQIPSAYRRCLAISIFARTVSRHLADIVDPANLTNSGHDNATGWGLRIGWMGKMTEKVTLGAAYSTKIKMGKFDGYRGLFAEQGDFDIPENFNLGIAVKATDAWTIAADYQRINYGKVKSVGNSSTQMACPGGSLFIGRKRRHRFWLVQYQRFQNWGRIQI